MAHSSALAWRIPWMEEPGRLQSMGSLRLDTTERLHFHFSLSCIGEGNGNTLQCSCLQNPRDREAWWAAIYGVAQSRTQLKRLSSSSSSTLGKGWKTVILQWRNLQNTTSARWPKSTSTVIYHVDILYSWSDGMKMALYLVIGFQQQPLTTIQPWEKHQKISSRRPF